MNYPLVTIAVLCYGHEQYVEACLESCTKQSYQHIELIIADDFSKDNSREVILKYLEHHGIKATLVFNEHNIGFHDTLNKCLQIVNGKYVSIIAADDFFFPDKIQIQVKKMEELGEEYGMVYSDFSIADENGKITDRSKFASKYGSAWEPPSGNIFSRVAADFFSWVQASLVRVKCLRETQFMFQPEIISEDWFLSLFISRYYKVYGMKDIVSVYRILPTSVTRTNFNSNGLVNVYKSHFRMFKYFYRHPLNNKIENNLLYKQLLKSVLYIIDHTPGFRFEKVSWLWRISLIKWNFYDFFKINKHLLKSAIKHK